ncbi:MAG: divalent-cation tolerance protein CutA [Cyanophyceae cyanobacterium]
MATPGIILTTTDSEAAAQALARSLVEQGLAAGVAISAIASIYRWREEICETAEWLLILNTDLDRLEAIKAFVRSRHAYEVPELMAFPASGGFDAYLQWIVANTRSAAG